MLAEPAKIAHRAAAQACDPAIFGGDVGRVGPTSGHGGFDGIGGLDNGTDSAFVDVLGTALERRRAGQRENPVDIEQRG